MKAIYKWGLGVLFVLGLAGAASAMTAAPVTQQAAVGAAVQQKVPAPSYTAPSSPQSQPTLSNSNYYTNVSGNTVHAPAYTTDGSVPAGASAQCADGTYSFSQHRRGTCSHHGGVSQWL